MATDTEVRCTLLSTFLNEQNGGRAILKGSINDGSLKKIDMEMVTSAALCSI